MSDTLPSPSMDFHNDTDEDIDCHCYCCTGACRQLDTEYGEIFYRDLLMSEGFEEGDNDW